MHSAETSLHSTGTVLDRLCSRPPEQIAQITLEQGDQRAHGVVESIERNLIWILNTTQLASSKSLERWPNILRSTLNYGIPDLSGKDLYEDELWQLEQSIADAIQNFEPRLDPASLLVQAHRDHAKMNSSAITLSVSALCLKHLGAHAIGFETQLNFRQGGVLDLKFA